MTNPIGFDGLPMENHHVARQDQHGQTNFITATEHRLIHADEIRAVADVFRQDGIKGFNANGWSAKQNDK